MKMRTVMLLLFLTSPALAGDEEYKLGADSMRQEGVPQGSVSKDVWRSQVFPETVRDYWVYVPMQYNGTKPACVMVFQDGHT
jgi:enterochelin esterase family protein